MIQYKGYHEPITSLSLVMGYASLIQFLAICLLYRGSKLVEETATVGIIDIA